MKHMGIAILAAVLFGCSLTAIADRFGDFWYTTDGESVTITDYENYFATELIIPDTIAGLPVTAIGARAFSGSSLFDVTIPEGVASIGSLAFSDSMNLANVMMPDSVTTIGWYAFGGCISLASIAIPDNVTNIGAYAFWRCGLTSLSIGSSVTNIDSMAFSSCHRLTDVDIGTGVLTIGNKAFFDCVKLNTVTIPERVTTIAESAFFYCHRLVAFTVDADNPHYCDIDGALFDKEATTLIRFPDGRSSSYAIPEGTSTIGISAFERNMNLANLTIPASVTNIGDRAFRSSTGMIAITVDPENDFYSDVDGVLFDKAQATLIYFPKTRSGSYVVPDSVTGIGESAFSNCYALSSLTIADSVETIEESALSSCNILASVYFAGDAPIPDASLFSESNNVTVYYLPNTTGWGDTFAGRSAVLWNPKINEPNLGVENSGIRFQITGTENIPIAVEATDDLLAGTWALLQTNVLVGGTLEFRDEDGGIFGNRVYRIAAP